MTEELKMAAQMGMRAGVEMAIAGLESAKRDPRSKSVMPVRDALQAGIDTIKKMAAEKWPEGKS